MTEAVRRRACAGEPAYDAEQAGSQEREARGLRSRGDGELRIEDEGGFDFVPVGEEQREVVIASSERRGGEGCVREPLHAAVVTDELIVDE